jgi:hypothetical protein
MIEAKTAREITKEHLISHEEALRIVLTDIDNRIFEASKMGKFYCEYIIAHPNAVDVVTTWEIKDILTPMGYYIKPILGTWFGISWDIPKLTLWHKFCMWFTL